MSLSVKLGLEGVIFMRMKTLYIFLISFFLSACRSDPCLNLCQDMRDKIAVCISTTPMEWSDFGAVRGNDFQNNCDQEWSQTRGELEVRVLEDVYEQCKATQKTIKREDLTCDEIMALYLAPVF